VQTGLEESQYSLLDALLHLQGFKALDAVTHLLHLR
jgi:hypothetical protein